MTSDLIVALQERLQARADLAVKGWWENYVKGSAPFRGVKMPIIRAVLHEWHRELVGGQLDREQQIRLALALLQEQHSEEKLAGILFLQEILLPAGVLRCDATVDQFAGLFVSGSIHDWNICDWFCVKVLGTLIQNEGPGCAHRIAAWRSAENLWQARASLVAFVKVAENRAYDPLIEESCAVLIRRKERFAKTAVGWILREISRHDAPFVKGVVEEHIAFFSRESLRNATKYFDKEERGRYMQMWKGTQREPGTFMEDQA